MNKRFLIIALCALVIIVGGCESKNIEKKSEIETEQSTSEKSAEELVIDNKTDLSKLIPDPKKYFPNTEIEIITDESNYTVYLDSVSEEDWNVYIEQCRADGFWINETYQSPYSWYVYSEDGSYKLLLDRYGDQNKYMTIVVKEENEDEK